MGRDIQQFNRISEVIYTRKEYMYIMYIQKRVYNVYIHVLPSVKVHAFSEILRPSLGKLIREVDAMLRPGGVLYVGFQSIATLFS